MKAYRIYIVDRNGRLQLGQAFEAADDTTAGRQAEVGAVRGRIAELWEGGRMVGWVSKQGVFIPGAD